MDRMRRESLDKIADKFLELTDVELRDAMKFRTGKEIYDARE